MKKPDASPRRMKTNKLSLRIETIRILTERELTLVLAGNCVNASAYSQNTSSNLAGGC